MGVVLGLHLTSDEVVWALVDEGEQALLDHDALLARTSASPVAAARSAQSIAAADGVAIDAVRVTGQVTDDVVARLQRAGFRCVERIDQADALTAGESFPPSLRAAAGAALCRPAPDCAQASGSGGRGRRVMATLAGAVAAAVLSVLFLVTGSVPQDARAVAAAPATVADSGWVSVPAPSPQAATVTRKFVTPATPRKVASPPVYTAAAPAPAPVAVPVAPVAAVAPVAPVAPVAEQHLSGTPTLAGPLPGLPMTDLSNMFTALP
ncbi:hypothetical protein [Mycobacterium sp. SMC-4]|uniref:hypothetical protein n=1 Tax=Mycobacterium sp. SMC-4 TaxID=2857059 RepID=UPI003D03F4BA